MIDSTDQIEHLYDRIVKLEESINDMKESVRKKEASSLRHFEKFVKLFNLSRMKNYLDYFEERLTYLSRRFQTEMLKHTVLSELGRLHPELFPFLCAALDKPDSWWERCNEFSLKQWAEIIKEEQATMILSLAQQKALLVVNS